MFIFIIHIISIIKQRHDVHDHRPRIFDGGRPSFLCLADAMRW